MSHRVLITGGSGYLGGTLLARLSSANLPSYEKLFALVRTDDQATAVKQYGAEPLRFHLRDETSVRSAIVDNHISIVFFLIDAFRSEAQILLIKALAEMKKATGKDVHFLHTSGAKIFSSHAGAPVDRPLFDNDPGLFDVQKSQVAPIPLMQTPVNTNNSIIEQAKALGVHSYIFVPCIVYGKGEGFGNPISIQTVAIVQAARKVGRVYSVDSGRPTWPVCHVLDNTNLYLELLRQILTGKKLGSGKQGYYLASSGSVAWEDLYAGIASALASHGLISDVTVQQATDKELTEMGDALGCGKELVGLQLGGSCTFTARNGHSIGWKAQYPAKHILETADEETNLILAHLKD